MSKTFIHMFWESFSHLREIKTSKHKIHLRTFNSCQSKRSFFKEQNKFQNSCDSQTVLKRSVRDRGVWFAMTQIVRFKEGLYAQKVETFAGGLCNSSLVNLWDLWLIKSVNFCACSGLLMISPALQEYLVNFDVCLSV